MATSAWVDAILFVLDYEGGYSNDSNDPGGETNFGISKRSYPNEDIANLTLERAKQLYRADFWNACKCDDLPRPLAIAVFDCAVNQGVGKAIRILQKALGVSIDGVLGPKTLAAAQKQGIYGAKRFLTHRLIAYHELMAESPRLEIYASNWFFRVVKLAELIFKDQVD